MKDSNMVKTLLTILGVSLGFSASQLTLAGDVKQSTVEIRVLKETNHEMRININEVIKQNQQFIQLLREQNELIVQQLRLIERK